MDKGKLKAVALKYDAGEDAAPKVLATGKGKLAERIIAIAKEEKVPIVENKLAADILSELEPGSLITQEMYEVVAEVLAFLISMDEQYSKNVSKKSFSQSRN